MRIATAIVFILTLAWSPVARAEGKALAEQLRELDLKALAKEKPLQAWIEDLQARRKAANYADVKAWRTVTSKEEWEKFKAPRIEALRQSLGQFPDAPRQLKWHVTGSSDGDGFIVINNVVYESRPGLWVAANLYAPKKAPVKGPGIIVIHSHHNPKTQNELQDMGKTWARLGCYVLVPDQLGHGERRQHPAFDAKVFPDHKPSRQDYYFRYNNAAQLHLVGESLIGWMAWDMMRGVDLLLAQPGIDKNAILLLGSVAGGGDPAAVTAAVDPRIAAVVPFNFGGPQPETKLPLPEDAELAFNYMGGGGWESTRNLRLNAKGGFLPWLIVGSVAPRGIIHAHEFAWDQKRDPVWARYQKIFSFYGKPDMLASVHGSGSVKGTPPESTHCNNIGAVHRKLMYPTLEKWFNIPVPVNKDYQERVISDKLQCWTQEWKTKLGPKQPREVALALAEERLVAARKMRARLATPEAGKLREQWASLLGSVEPGNQSSGYDVQTITKPALHRIGTRKDGMGAYLYLPPGQGKGMKHAVVVGFCQAGIAPMLQERAGTIAALLEGGTGVFLVELRGMGSKEGRTRTSSATSLSASEQSFGETVIGQHVRELRELLAHLRTSEGVDGNRIALWGDSLAKPNGPDKRLEVPLDVALPAHAEPGAALVALLTALYEPDVRAVYAHGGLATYKSLLETPYLYVPHDAVVPGALAVSDWTDLVAALAPRAVRIDGTVDGVNRPVEAKGLSDAYGTARAAFTKAGQADRLSLETGGLSADIARWLAASVK